MQDMYAALFLEVARMAMQKKQMDDPALSLYWKSAFDGDAVGLSEAIGMGVDPEAEAPNREGTALHVAVARGHVECVEILADFCNCRKRCGVRDMTPLALAASYGHARCVEILMPLSSANDRNATGSTAFMLAVEDGHVEAARLLAPEANMSHRNALRQSALMLAAGGAFPAAAEMILSRSKESAEEALECAMMGLHGERVGEAKQCAMLILEKLGSQQWVLDCAKDAAAKARDAGCEEMANFVSAWLLAKEERAQMADAIQSLSSDSSTSGKSKRGRL